MAELDNLTLMMAIQAVRGQIEHLEALLNSQAARDSEGIGLLILAYEKAADRLREVYEEQWSENSNLPPYSRLVS